ncbi:aldo/keto reductase [Clostridium peptidivorans]|uniref:aldo/keto reductase n=1 Tax=Clostridium peptidivorans TaxID=100174 RepID=UPI000BE238B9|nr:aldo/keto reductase [Clostridium peptidivorans]
MKYRILGGTGLKVSAVGFGGIPIQKVDEKETAKLLEYAETKGINFIDSARGYTISEELIGNALKGRREKWIIATKSMARDKESMLKDVEISLKNLQTNYIDLYQLHNVRTQEQLDKVLSEDGAYSALLELKKKGIIRHIGITSHSLDMLKVAIETGKFETIMYPYNIVETQGEEVFKRAKELNIGVIAMKPMAGGALTKGDLAIKFILSNESISTAIPGMASINEIDINTEVVSKEYTLTEDEKEEIKKISEELGTEFCRRCSYCAPCTAGIDIPSIFVLQAYKERYGLPDWADDRYQSAERRAKDCIECGVCEERCPYDLPIRDMLKRVRKIFNE